MFACLPQYDLPELQSVTDAWWQGIARHLRAHGVEGVPDALTRDESGEVMWRKPDLLLTQTCGYPLMTELRGDLRPMATPIYDCEGCAGPRYSSAVIVREDSGIETPEDLRDARVAVNSWNSHSGMNAMRAFVARLAGGRPFFSEVVLSGGHRLSAAAVRDGRADVAAVDGVTWALAGWHQPGFQDGLRVLAWTEMAPSLPYAARVEASDDLVRRTQAALIDAAADDALKTILDVLLIAGFELCDVDTYWVMIDWKEAAEAAGYPEIC